MILKYMYFVLAVANCHMFFVLLLQTYVYSLFYYFKRVCGLCYCFNMYYITLPYFFTFHLKLMIYM